MACRSRQLNMLLLKFDSDDELEMLAIVVMEEEQQDSRRYRGNVQGHTTIWRERVQGHERLYRDYFAKNPTYPPTLF